MASSSAQKQVPVSPLRIARADDERLSLYRGVADADLLRAHGLFVAEGRLVVRRVLADGRYRVRSVLVNDAALRDLAEPLAAVGAEVPVLVGAADIFSTITGHDIHRGCLALVERPAPSTMDEVLSSADRIVVLEDVANADNIGGVFRNAAAFGAGVVITPATCDPLYRKAIRTSMAAVLHVPFARSGAWPGALDRIRVAGFAVVALTPREPSEPIEDFAARAPRRTALIVGSEGGGVSRAAEASADSRVRIPMAGGVDSLNLAVATGIALYALDVARRTR
jgi:tRNA G18 (ribose-2'-O)-methylase SpoU